MKTARILLIVGVIAFVVVGCGPKPPEQPPAPTQGPPASTQGPPAPKAPEPAPKAEAPKPEPAPAPPEKAAEAPKPSAAEAQWVAPVLADNVEMKLVDQEGPGKLYQAGEQRICVMQGAPAAMGFQHGRLLAKQIRHIVREGYMQKSLYGAGYTEAYVNEQAALMEKHFPPAYIEEMKGIVEGLKAAGVQDVTYENIRGAACTAELQHHDPGQPPTGPKTPAAPAMQCSNFAVFGQWTQDGRLLHGRNLDWNIGSGAQEDAAILIWRPEGGTPFMMPSWAGSIGSVSGLNAKGITIGEMTSSTSDETYDGTPLMIIMRRVLQEASTLDEAVGIMVKGPRTLGWNFVIGDAKIPDARALEVDAVTCDVFAPLDPKETAENGHLAMKDAVRRTNHPCGKTLLGKVAREYQGKVGPGMDLSDLNVVKQLLATLDTWQRYDWLGKEIQKRQGQINVEQALQLLGNGPVFCDATLHSWVFDPKNQTAYVAVAGWNPPTTASRRPYLKLDLKEWFG